MSLMELEDVTFMIILEVTMISGIADCLIIQSKLIMSEQWRGGGGDRHESCLLFKQLCITCS